MTVLLGVAHGSRDPRAQEVVRALLAGAAAERPGLRVADAYVDNASPSPRSALSALAAEGVDDVVVVPLLLTAASHAKTDVAGSVQEGRAAHPGLRLRYARPLWPSLALVDVALRRLDEAGAPRDAPVLVVAGGSLDPDANASVAAAARLLLEAGGYPEVEVAFASTARPSVPDALARLHRSGASTVGVARWFLGPGRLPAAVARQAVEGPVDVVVAEPLGAAPELSRLVLERFDEAREGDVRMPCDACVHRVPFPGREVALGMPQRPHPHPDDA